MKTIIAFMVVLFLVVGCSTVPMKYEKIPFTPPPKQPVYALPADPFAGEAKPVPIFLKKDATGKYGVCKAEEAEIIGYSLVDANKIAVHLTYYKAKLPELENLINIHIQRENVLIDLVVDQDVAKELFRQLYVEMYNKAASDKNLFNWEKGGYIAVILGMLIEIGILVAK